jgi:hypothetical protein
MATVCRRVILIRLARLGRLLVADSPSRQARQQAYVPEQSPRDICSREQHQYLDPVPGMQAKYAANATYNGADALRRLRGGEGG